MAVESTHILDLADRRVLVAEDGEISQKLFADILRHEGYDVRCVTDGAEAVAAVREERYDLVLMDLRMPHMDGTEATRRIRALPGGAGQMPILMMSTLSSLESDNVGLDCGADEMLLKPIGLPTLRNAVRRWLSAGRGQARSSRAAG